MQLSHLCRGNVFPREAVEQFVYRVHEVRDQK
jgi:hypothetical protein